MTIFNMHWRLFFPFRLKRKLNNSLLLPSMKSFKNQQLITGYVVNEQMNPFCLMGSDMIQRLDGSQNRSTSTHNPPQTTPHYSNQSDCMITCFKYTSLFLTFRQKGGVHMNTHLNHVYTFNHALTLVQNITMVRLKGSNFYIHPVIFFICDWLRLS